jgi:adenylate kinase
MRHINVGELIMEHKCYSGTDEELDTNILDEEKLLDLMEPLFDEAADEGIGIIADFHVCEMFPERWFDLILVLRTTTEILFDRLTARGYADRKRDENMESEIMQVILEEAREAYDPNIVHEIPSNTIEDMESAICRVQEWTRQWLKDHGQ